MQYERGSRIATSTAEVRTDILITAADHPSLDRDVEHFLERLRSEERFFGPTARLNPKPSRSILASLHAPGGFRLAAVACGAVVGLARVDDDGDLVLVVDQHHRGRGVGTELGRAVVLRAQQLGYGRLVLRTSQRSRAARRVGEELGATVVHRGRGRTDVIFDLASTTRTA